MDIKAVIRKFNDNIFNALKRNKGLRDHALAYNDSPELTMDNQLTGYLNLSQETLKTLGEQVYYYVVMKHPKSIDDIRDCLNRVFNGNVSSQALTHLRFISFGQIALDLRLPIEQILYGTVNIHKIAKYNYEHYSSLDKMRRGYLLFQSGRHMTVSYYAKYLHVHQHMPYTKIAKAFHITRQNLYRYFNGDNKLLYTRTSYQAMCQAIGEAPIDVLTYPLVTKQSLRDDISRKLN